MEESKNKNQTAVQWLIEQKRKFHAIINDDLEKALEMEKEQIRLVYEGILQNVGTSVKQSDLPTFEHYYTQTFTEPKND